MIAATAATAATAAKAAPAEPEVVEILVVDEVLVLEVPESAAGSAEGSALQQPKQPTAEETTDTAKATAKEPATAAPAAAGADIPAPKAISDLVAKYPNKLLMLVFWSVATEADSPSFTWLNEMHRRYANQGLQIVAVNQDKEAGQGDAMAAQQGAQFEVNNDDSGALRRALWVGKLPATYLLNDTGELLGSHTGFNDDIRGSYEDEIRRLLRAMK